MDNQAQGLRERFLSKNERNANQQIYETNPISKDRSYQSQSQSKGEDEVDDMVKYMRQLRESFQQSATKLKGSVNHNVHFHEQSEEDQGNQKQNEVNENSDEEEERQQNNTDYLTDTQSLTNDSEYFKQDSSDFDDLMNQAENINLNMGDTHNYYASWSWSQFFEFFLYHLIFYILGPFCIIVFYPFNKTYLYRNLGFNIGGDFSFVQFILWITNLFMSIAYFAIPETQNFVELFEIYNMWIMIVFRIFSIACKYAMLHPLTIMCYKMRILAKDEKVKDFYLANWKYQTDLCVIEELYSAQYRNEIDLSLFSTHFFEDINENTYNRLSEIQQLQLQSFQFSRISRAFLGKNANKVAEQISQFNIEQTGCRKSQFYNGMVVLHHLVDQFNHSYGVYKKNYVVFIFAFLRSIIWFVYILSHDPKLFMEFGWFESIIGTSMVMFNFILYSAIGYFLLAVLCDSHRINFLMVQMLFLIKPRKDQNFLETKKVLPTLNLTCSNNFKNWIQLRRLSVEYGKRFWKRGQSNLSFLLLYSLYPVICIILHLLDIFTFCELEIWYLSYDFLLISFCVALCLFYSASINYSFVYHIQILEEIRIVFRNLLREDLLQNNNEVSNFLYRTILKRLRQKAENNSEAIQDFILQIVDSIDDSKNELQLLQQTEPFQCFGFTITFSILKSGLLFLFSILTFSINVYLKTH